jgi:hypothetical protein
MAAQGARTEIVRAVDHDIATGVWPDMTGHGAAADAWPRLYPKVLAADILGSNVFNLAALIGLGAVVAGGIKLHRRVVIFEGAVALWIAALAIAAVTSLITPAAALALAVLAPVRVRVGRAPSGRSPSLMAADHCPNPAAIRARACGSVSASCPASEPSGQPPWPWLLFASAITMSRQARSPSGLPRSACRWLPVMVAAWQPMSACTSSSLPARWASG